MNLTIDLGNTRAKMAVFDGRRLVAERRCEQPRPDDLLDMVRQYRPERVACCSVGAPPPVSTPPSTGSACPCCA